ncbi:MAG: GNAT family N-acetyltransferase [Candidatus Ranarchaeia archaeon]|jgi:RimJ/RimL family protein N-acetyltransferase
MIEGKHIQLRVIEQSDLVQIREWWSNPDLRGSEDIFLPLTEPQMEKKYKKWLKDPNVFRLLIEKKKPSDLLGKLILHRRYGGVELIVPKPDATSEPGVMEALYLGLTYLFQEESNHNCVSLWIPSWNTWLIGIAQEIGMKLAGKIRRTGMRENQYYGTVVYDMLQSEFLSLKIKEKLE